MSRAELKTHPLTLESESAVNFLVEEKKLGRLPGCGENDHGVFDSKPFDVLKGESVVYPLSFTFQAKLHGSTNVNFYVVNKLEKGAQWQVSKAWQTDSYGNLIKDLPLNE